MSKVKSILIIFLDIKGIVHKEFVLEGQTVNSAYYCDTLRRVGENMRRIRSELWRKKIWLLHHDSAPFHTSFLPGNFELKQHGSSPHPPYVSLFRRLKIERKGRNFDTSEVMETESQAMLNTLTDHDFQYASKKRQRRWGRCIRAEGDYFEGDGGQQNQS
jgi:hypothetical protein